MPGRADITSVDASYSSFLSGHTWAVSTLANGADIVATNGASKYEVKFYPPYTSGSGMTSAGTLDSD